MKRKIAILNLVLMAVVQFTIAYKSFHAFSHHLETHTHTEHSLKGKAVVSADTHEECSVCDFQFDYFIAPQQFCLKLDFPYTHIPYQYNSIEGSASFTGSLFALRAPPALA